MFGMIARAASKIIRPAAGAILSAGRAARNIPGATAIPVVGNVLGAAGGLAAISSAMGSRGSSNLPALPSGGLPALPGAGAPAIVGQRGIFQNDPNIVAALQPWAISKANLRVSYRSPMKGFVIRYDSNGDPYAIPKTLARQYLGWKPAKKPPISVGEYQALKKADRTVKKMRKVYSMISRVDAGTTKGGKVVIKRRKKGG
jgi:hypothetical protein